jgi:hypothetical protein
MADPLISQEDAENLKDYYNVQKQLSDLIKTQAAQIEDIRDIDGDLTTQLEERVKKEQQLLDLQVDQFTQMAKFHEELSTIPEAGRAELKVAMAGLQQRMLETRKHIGDLRELNGLQIAMAKEARERELAHFRAMRGLFDDQLKFQDKIFGRYQRAYNILSKYPFALKSAAGWLAAIIALAGNALERFLEWDAAAAKFRINMGLTRDAANGLRSMVEKTTIGLMRVGVVIQDTYLALQALGEQMGGVHNVSQKLLQTTALFKAQLGVAEDITGDFMRQMAAISNSSMQAQESTAFIAHSLSEAAGVNLGKVMSDISKMSGTTVTMVSRLPGIILRTAIEARRLNTSINEMANASRQLLNFSESVNAEMEASVLLGHSVNLQRARELAYRRDIEGSTKEILRLSKQVNFETLDPFQAEAFARATGRSVDELMKMLQAEKQIEIARRDPNLSKQVAAYERMRNLSEDIQKSNAKNVELSLLQRANQDRVTILQNKWNNLMARATQLLFPVIDGILSIATVLIDIVPLALAFSSHLGKAATGIGSMLSGFTKVASTIGGISTFTFGMLTFSEKIVRVLSKLGPIGAGIVKVFGFAGSIFARIGSLLGVFGKFLGPIGIVITAFQAIYGFVQGFKEGGFLGGLKGAFNAIVQPFVDAWNWIKGIFVGHSPSKLGLGIVNGIASVSAMIFDAITMPFRNAFSWIVDKIPGMSGVADKIKGGISGVLNLPKEKAVSPMYAPVIQVSPTGITPAQNLPTPKETARAQEAEQTGMDQSKLLMEILMQLQALNKNMAEGKIAINLDSQLVSTTLARQTEFRGGYGVNRA